MLDQLIQSDHNAFLAINQGLSNPFFDWLMPLLRNRFFWTPLYAFIIIFLLKNYKKTGFYCILFLLITFGLSDFFSASVLKPLVERLRPCNEPGFREEINLLVSCGTGFSFPSSHATNHFGIAMFLSAVFYTRWKPIAPLTLLWAFAIAFAQIYVGVHFPLDAIAGALIGSLIGYVVGTVFLTAFMQKQWNSGS